MYDYIQTRSTRPQKLCYFTPITDNYHKWLPYQILGGKTVKNVQISPQTTEIWPKWLNGVKE